MGREERGAAPGGRSRHREAAARGKPRADLPRNWIVAIQDMGAAGLASSSAEMAARGGVGVEIDTGLGPKHKPGMTPYEILLSQSSQERMLVVAEPHRVARGPEAVCATWELSSHADRALVTDVTVPGAPQRVRGRGDSRPAPGGGRFPDLCRIPEAREGEDARGANPTAPPAADLEAALEALLD